MPNDSTPRLVGCVTGRFQPLHEGHLQLIAVALAECDEVIIGVTNPDLSRLEPEPDAVHRHMPESNPFSYAQRASMIRKTLDALGHGRRTTIVPFDLAGHAAPVSVDLEVVQYVRSFSSWEFEKVRRLEAWGYEVRHLRGSMKEHSGTSLREAVRTASLEWEEWVPAEIRDEVREALQHQVHGPEGDDGE